MAREGRSRHGFTISDTAPTKAKGLRIFELLFEYLLQHM
jgi:hypothetical protein